MERRDQLTREGYVEFLRSKDFDPYFRKLHRPPRWRSILAVPMILSIAGVGKFVVSAKRMPRPRIHKLGLVGQVEP
jgi:hypothetical protein